MTTDFSQAIINGFGIAAKWREMGAREEEMRRDDAYRRDALTENRRQFDLGLKETVDARNQRAGLADRQLQLQRDEHDSQDRYRQASVKNDGRRLGLAERGMNEERDAREREEEDAYIGQIAEYRFERERAGNPMPERELAQLFARSPVGRRVMGRAGLPTESVRDGTLFDTAVAGPDGSILLAGRRADGSVAVPDQGRTSDNSTPPATIAPGNTTTLFTGAMMSTPAGIAAARRHAALSSGKKEADLTEQEIQAELVRANAAADAKYKADLAAYDKSQQSLASQPAPVAPSAIGEAVADFKGAQGEAVLDVAKGVAEGRPGLFLRGTGGSALGLLAAPFEFGLAGAKSVANSQFVRDTLGTTDAQAPQAPQAPVAPPPQAPAPVTALPADHPLMQRRAELAAQRGLDARVERGMALGLTPDQAGAYAASGQPSESVANAMLRESGELRRQYAAAEAEYEKRAADGYKQISSAIDDVTKGDEWLQTQRGQMNAIMGMANVTTGGALAADPSMRTAYANSLVSLMRMSDSLDGVDQRYKNDILGAMAMKSVNPTSRSVFDVSDPDQVEEVADRLNTLYRGVPEGISPKQQALLADLAASDFSPDEMARARDKILRSSPGAVDDMYWQTFTR